MRKTITGYCPTQNKNYSISIDVISNATLDNPNSYELGMTNCEYAGTNECDISNNCPIRNSIE